MAAFAYSISKYIAITYDPYPAKKAWATVGPDRAMNSVNTKPKPNKEEPGK